MTPSDVKTVVAHLDDFIELPDGIERLRKAVLTLAVAGSLVPHIAKEGTGKELCAAIQKSKAKPRVDNLATEVPFPVPSSWDLVRLDSVYEVNPRNVVPDGTSVSFLPMAKIHSEWSRNPDLDEEREWRSVKKGFTHIKENDIVLAKITPCFENEKSGIARNLTNGFAAGTTELHVFRDPTGKLFPEYLLCVLRSPLFMEQAVKNMTGTAGQKRVPTKFVESFPFPLPPAAEQERIVKKVNEVMRQLDELERQKIERDAVRVRLARSAMQALGRGEKTLAFQIMPELIKTSEDVALLEQAILTLAVSGQLTPQNSADGTGDELYAKVQSKRKEYEATKSGKKSKVRSSNPIDAEEVQYTIPSSWKWVRLGDLFDVQRGGSPRPIKSFLTDDPDGLNWIKIGDSEQGSQYIHSTREKIRPDGLAKSRKVEIGDLLLTNSMSYGRPYILKTDGCIHDGWLALRPYDRDLNIDFIFFLLSSAICQNQFDSLAAGAVVQNLNADKVADTLVPLPPLKEQQRIAEKISHMQLALAEIKNLLA